MSRRPVDLAVSRLRDALWLASSNGDGAANGPGALCGMIFHETMAGLLKGAQSWHGVLTRESLEDHEMLRRHAYDRLVGPRLTRHETGLTQSGREALWMWNAVGEACHWLVSVLVAARDKEWIRYDAAAEKWVGAEVVLTSEKPLAREFFREGWTAPVRVHGYADAVLRDPESGRWCCIEFKLSESGGALDVGQAALYQMLLEGDGNSDVALVRFLPERSERLLSASDLEPARESLIGLAGRLAGVAKPESAEPEGRYASLGNAIIRVLNNFNIDASLVGQPAVGPSFVRYSLKPGRAVGVKKILNAADDVGVQLGIPSPMIELEDGVLVVDVPRADDRETVPFARVREALAGFDPTRGSSEIPLGVDLNNRLRSVDLAASESPHILVAGTAGSGKTEWLRSAVAALLLSNTPSTLRLVLIDPKRTAFGDLAGSPFLLHSSALLHPPDASVTQQLDKLIEEMETRYREFQAKGVDDLIAYRQRPHEYMPRIVCFIDEFADLMADGRERKLLEDRVVRLGAKARAAGIHLILATQHPDAKTVTGRLQANLSVRVCLRTTTWQQSMVALKRRGGERLLGKGDLFFSQGDRLWRLQSPYLNDAERREIFQRGSGHESAISA